MGNALARLQGEFDVHDAGDDHKLQRVVDMAQLNVRDVKAFKRCFEQADMKSNGCVSVDDFHEYAEQVREAAMGRTMAHELLIFTFCCRRRSRSIRRLYSVSSITTRMARWTLTSSCLR